MANEPPFYAEIDGAWHELDQDGAVCGLEVPFGTPWTRDLPDEVHCGVNKTKPKAKAKK